jgi:hypothetical protein
LVHASRRLLFHVAALIGHVSGPHRLRDILAACGIANQTPRAMKPRTASSRPAACADLTVTDLAKALPLNTKVV